MKAICIDATPRSYSQEPSTGFQLIEGNNYSIIDCIEKHNIQYCELYENPGFLYEQIRFITVSEKNEELLHITQPVITYNGTRIGHAYISMPGTTAYLNSINHSY